MAPMVPTLGWVYGELPQSIVGHLDAGGTSSIARPLCI